MPIRTVISANSDLAAGAEPAVGSAAGLQCVVARRGGRVASVSVSRVIGDTAATDNSRAGIVVQAPLL